MKKLILIIILLSAGFISFAQFTFDAPNQLWTMNNVGISTIPNFNPLEKFHVRAGSILVDYTYTDWEMSPPVTHRPIVLFACADPSNPFRERVGILTNEPTQTLHVKGDIRLGNELRGKLVFGLEGADAEDYFEFNYRASNSNLPFFNIYWRDENKLSMKVNGYLGLGTSDPQALLHLANGDFIITNNDQKEFKVEMGGNVTCRQVDVTAYEIPDFAFNSDYKMMSLSELETFVNKNKHLPGIKSAKEYQELGVMNLAELNLKLLLKVEELTLYIIEQDKRIEKLEKFIK